MVRELPVDAPAPTAQATISPSINAYPWPLAKTAPASAGPAAKPVVQASV